MHGRVTAMGIGIVSPKTAIASLTLKLHFTHKRMNSENVKFLKTIEDNSAIETGSKWGSSGNNKMNEYRPRLWIEGAKKCKIVEEQEFKMNKMRR